MRLKLWAFLDLALGLLILFEAAAIVQVLLNPNSLYVNGSLAWFQSQLLLTLSSVSPVLLLVLVYAWSVRLFFRIAGKRFPSFNRIQGLAPSGWKRRFRANGFIDYSVLRNPLLLLAISIVASALLGALPYRADLNPSGALVGIDTPSYVGWTVQMLSKPPEQAVVYAFGSASQGSRPLPLLLFYSVALLGVSPTVIMKLCPSFLGPLFCLSVYAFVRTGLEDRRAAGMAAMFAGLSFNVTVGIWAGYLANWLAMIFAFFFSTTLLTFSKTHRKTSFLQLLALSIAMQLTHPWTWILVLAGMLVFTLTRGRMEIKKLALPMLSLFIIGGVIDFGKNVIAGGVTLAADVGTKGSVFGVPELLAFWPNLLEALTITYDGLLGSTILLGLGALSLLSIASRNWMKSLLASWILVTSLVFPFFNSFHQTRLIYDLPIPALATIGMLLFFDRVLKGEDHRATLVFLIVMLSSANYAVASVIRA